MSVRILYPLVTMSMCRKLSSTFLKKEYLGVWYQAEFDDMSANVS